jgi:hypothetical protein
MPMKRREAPAGAAAPKVSGVGCAALAARRSGRRMVKGRAGLTERLSQCQVSAWQVIVPDGVQSLVGL